MSSDEEEKQEDYYEEVESDSDSYAEEVCAPAENIEVTDLRETPLLAELCWQGSQAVLTIYMILLVLHFYFCQTKLFTNM